MGVEKCLFLLYCECMGNNRSTLEFRADISDPRLKSLVVIIDPHWNLEAQGSSPQVLQIR